MPPALAPLPSSVLPITPNIHIYTEADGFTPSTKQYEQEKQSLNSNLEDSQHHHWTAPWRAGLPTPPSDMMNGVAYNTFVPSTSTTTTNPKTYGGKHNGLSLHPYGKFPSQSRSSFDPTSLYPSSSSKPQSNVAPSSSTKAVPPAESVSQKKTTSTSIPSYLQIPSSISDSKGSLAEFAAQVWLQSIHEFWFCGN